MTQPVCPNCGSPINESMQFCRLCGCPLGPSSGAMSSVEEAVRQTPAPSAMVCATCGTAAEEPGQMFCGVCGSPLAEPSPTQHPPAPAPTPDGTNAGLDGFARARSKLDDFMGASIDTSSVGADFNANQVTLANASDDMLAAAFAYFGKSYTPAGKSAATVDIAAVERRERIEAQEAEARTKEARDFSAHEGGTFCGAFTTKLHAGAAPVAAMVNELHGKAAKRQDKNRLKHKVALGDMDKRDAVSAAERL